ncbi:MAG: hypothetical protein LBR15_09960 [Methanobrevibacter sp.]|jgi:hypothetical protein|nr:hypothetical protein [Candidatus Methanovirga australis]
MTERLYKPKIYKKYVIYKIVIGNKVYFGRIEYKNKKNYRHMIETYLGDNPDAPEKPRFADKIITAYEKYGIYTDSIIATSDSSAEAEKIKKEVIIDFQKREMKNSLNQEIRVK